MSNTTIDNPSEIETAKFKTQQNLLPVGAIVFIVLMSFFSLIRDISEPIGIKLKIEPYITLWVGSIGSLLLTCIVGYYIVKDIWKRISINYFKQKNYIMALIVIAISIFGLKILSTYLTNAFYSNIMNGRVGFFYMAGYLEFKTVLFPITSGLQAIIILIILGLKNFANMR